MLKWMLLLSLSLAGFAQQIKSGPALPLKAVPDWAQLPKGYNFGETSGVDVDKDDNVWVFNRGAHPVMQFDKNGKLLQSWTEMPLKSSHGLRVDPDGNIWTIDVEAHRILKLSASGRVLMVLGGVGGAAGKDNDTKDA